MPVADTEVLFTLRSGDPRHQKVARLLGSRADIVVPDVALLEFQIVLRARGRKPAELKTAMLALREILSRHNVKEVKTISSSSLALRCELEEKYGLSYFDSLVAVAALTVDRKVVSSDKAFDAVPGLERVPLE